MDRLRLRHSQALRARLKLIGGIKLAGFIGMGEDEFSDLVRRVEDDPLFRSLAARHGIVAFSRRPRGCAAERSFRAVEDDRLGGGQPLELASLLAEHPAAVSLVRRIGLRKFTEYFLDREGSLREEETCSSCGLTPAEVRSVSDLVTGFAARSELYAPSALARENGVAYSKVARIEPDGQGGFLPVFFSPHLARGPYVIDYEKLTQLRGRRALSAAEDRGADRLLRTLELINTRKNLLHNILLGVAARQGAHLASGGRRPLAALAQKELAAELGVQPSTVCRAISVRSVELPWGEERPIASFFPGPKEHRRALVAKVFAAAAGTRPSDRQVMLSVQERFGLKLSRRTVANYRRELGLPASRQRGAH